MVGFESKPVTMERLREVVSGFVGEPRMLQADMAPGPLEEAPMTTPMPRSLAELPEFAGLDEARQNELIEALGEDVFIELVDSFFTDATSLIGELEKALEDRDEASVDRALHTIKGAAVNVGLNGIAGRASAMRGGMPTATDVRCLNEEIETLKYNLVA